MMRNFVLIFGMMVTVIVVEAHPKDECPNPLRGFIEIVTDQMKDAEQPMANKTFGCLNVGPKPEIEMQAAKCFVVKSVQLLLKSIIKGVIPTRVEIAGVVLNQEKCKLHLFPVNFTTENGMMNFTNLFNFIDTDFQFEGDDSDVTVLKDIVKGCSEGERDKPEADVTPAENVSLSQVTCTLKKVIDHCKDRPIDGLLPTSLALSTITQDGQCVGVNLPESYVPTVTKCLNQSRDYIMTDIIPKDFKNGLLLDLFEMRGSGDIMLQMIKDRLYPIGKKVLAKFSLCILSDMGVLVNDDQDISLDVITNSIIELNSWEGITDKRNEIATGFTNCFNINGLTDPVNTINLAKFNENPRSYHDVYFKCFLTKYYAYNCGMNNLITELFLPMTNEVIGSQIIADFKMVTTSVIATVRESIGGRVSKVLSKN